MPNFSPDQCSFGDLPGLGYWDDGHHREHAQFSAVLAAAASPVQMPTYDFLQFLSADGAVRASQLTNHAQVHELLRATLNVPGVDLEHFDLANEQDFYSFLGYHATEHALMRQALGVS